MLCLFLDSFNTIISYIDDQFERYLHDESGLNRRHIVDNRVHCCFYFISPLGHGWDLILNSTKSFFFFFFDTFHCHRCECKCSHLYGFSCLMLQFCRLKPLDVQFMKAIHNKVNVVPVIAKADTLTLRERERLKRRVSIQISFQTWFEHKSGLLAICISLCALDSGWNRWTWH